MSKNVVNRSGKVVGTFVPVNDFGWVWTLIVIGIVGVSIACLSPFAFVGGAIYFLTAISLPEGTPDKGFKIAMSLLIMAVSAAIACLSGGILLFQYWESVTYYP